MSEKEIIEYGDDKIDLEKAFFALIEKLNLKIIGIYDEHDVIITYEFKEKGEN